MDELEDDETLPDTLPATMATTNTRMYETMAAMLRPNAIQPFFLAAAVLPCTASDFACMMREGIIMRFVACIASLQWARDISMDSGHQRLNCAVVDAIFHLYTMAVVLFTQRSAVVFLLCALHTIAIQHYMFMRRRIIYIQ